MDFAERVVVITGATGGLGRVAARRFAEQGAKLALLGSHQGRLDSLIQELGVPSEQSQAFVTDLRDFESARSAAHAVAQRFGRADVLLHLVGGWVGGAPVVETSSADLTAMLDQHVWTTWHVLQAFVPLLVANQWGRVIAVSSPAATRPAAKSGPYAAGKAGEEALILTLAQELKNSSVTANILLVRAIDIEHKRDREPSRSNASWTTPEELVAAMLYLCSTEAGHISGIRLNLAGPES